MRYRQTRGEKIADAVLYVLLAIITLVALYPIWYVVMASISDGNALMRHTGPVLTPQGFSLAAYQVVLNNKSIYAGYANTIFYVVVGTMLNMIMTTLGAYVLSRKHFFWANPIMMLITITMFFSGGMIPTYLLVEKLGLVDTRWSLIIPGLVNAYNLIILRTAFAGVPDALEESAKIEGANDFQIMWKIYMPVSKATLAVIVLYYAVSHWNGWFSAVLYLRTRSLYPLQILLREILIEKSLDSMKGDINMEDLDMISDTIKYATVIISSLPIMLLYPFLQKYFVKGVMIGSVKG
ncbi:MAG: carbohydrate ABC transporter permease [Clostridia bacterium]|nr:carbohydrate ABC transporter permease [Clostridia bacterium]MDD6039788.1 carbohydrate ABC transporter permease [Clostridia bacterium]